MIFRLYIFLILGCAVTNCKAQGGSVRIALYGGGNINFVFNTMKSYNTGITYSNWTTLGIEIKDDPTPPDYTKWELLVSASDPDGDGELTGTIPANTLPFDVIRIRAHIFQGCPSCHIINPSAVPLSKVPTVLVDGSALGGPSQIPPNLDVANDQIQLSYECGVDTKILSLSPVADYYSDDIFIDLIMSP